MHNKGRGAFVDPLTTFRLNQGELDILTLMMSAKTIHPDTTDRHTSSGWADLLTIPEHRVSGYLSRLKGMDLVKSTGDKMTLTEDEQVMADGFYAPWIYWVGLPGEPIYKRAELVLANHGKLDNIKDMSMQFGLPLWPQRLEKIVTMRTTLSNLQDQEITINFNINEEKMLKLIALKQQGEVMVTIESL